MSEINLNPQIFIFYCNPYNHPENEFLIDEDSKIEHLYNSTYKITYFLQNNLSDILSIVTNIGFIDLYYCFNDDTDINNMLELFREVIYDFMGLKIYRFQVVKYKIKDEIYTKVIPFINDDRIYISNNCYCNFIHTYKNVLTKDNKLILDDRNLRLYNFIEYELNSKSLKRDNINSSNKFIYGKVDDEYINHVDHLNIKYMRLNMFSLIEFKGDPMLLIMFELIKLFKINTIDKNKLIFSSELEIHMNIKQWIINSTLRILNDKLPLIRIQTTNLLEVKIDDEIRAKIKLAAILSFQEMNIPINIDLFSIKVHSDLSIQIPVFDLNMINEFNTHFNNYINQIDNWTILLCSNLNQGITLKNLFQKDVTFEKYKSYVLDIDRTEIDDIDSYLIILTDTPRMIKNYNNIQGEIINDNVIVDRGFKQIVKTNVNIPTKIVLDKGCDNENIFKFLINDQIFLITKDEDEIKKFEKKYSKINNLWLNYHASKNKMLSNLILLLN